MRLRVCFAEESELNARVAARGVPLLTEKLKIKYACNPPNKQNANCVSQQIT